MLQLVLRDSIRAAISTDLRRQLVRQVRRAMKAAQVDHAEVCLTLSDNQELHALNRMYAEEDHPTDVLSFAQCDASTPSGATLLALVLGDIIISVEIAEQQALSQGHSLLEELLHLSVHGLCHLLGMDHRDAQEERWMFGYEALLRQQARASGRILAHPFPSRPGKTGIGGVSKQESGGFCGNPKRGTKKFDRKASSKSLNKPSTN